MLYFDLENEKVEERAEAARLLGAKEDKNGNINISFFESEEYRGKKFKIYIQEMAENTGFLIRDEKGNEKVYKDYIYNINGRDAQALAEDVLYFVEGKEDVKGYNTVDDIYDYFERQRNKVGERNYHDDPVIRLDNTEEKYTEFSKRLYYKFMEARIKEDNGVSRLRLFCNYFGDYGESFLKEEFSVRKGYKEVERDIRKEVEKAEKKREHGIGDVLHSLHDVWKGDLFAKEMKCYGVDCYPDKEFKDRNVKKISDEKNISSYLGMVFFKDKNGNKCEAEKYKYADEKGNILYTMEMRDEKNGKVDVWKFKENFTSLEAGYFFRQYTEYLKEQKQEIKNEISGVKRKR